MQFYNLTFRVDQVKSTESYDRGGETRSLTKSRSRLRVELVLPPHYELNDIVKENVHINVSLNYYYDFQYECLRERW